MIGEAMKVGDKVIINIPQENWDWGYRPVKKQKGTSAKITGFGEIAYSRIQSYGLKPGYYVNHCWCTLDKIEGSIGTFCLEPMNRRKYEAAIKIWCEKSFIEKHVFLRELPEMKFWEHDMVTVKWNHKPGSETVKIAWIEYNYLNQKRDDGSPMPEYSVHLPDQDGGFNAGTCSVNESQLTLISRGNVWKYFNGEKPEFKDLSDEAQFFTMLGHCDEVPNAKGTYAWEKDELLAAIKAGTVDGMNLINGMFGLGMSHRADRFRDRELGERVRQATIKGFNLGE